MLFARLFDRLIKFGSLSVIDAFGKTHAFAGAEGPRVTIRLHERALHSKLFFNPRLYLGEAYMDGTLTVEEGTLSDLLELCIMNLAVFKPHPAHVVYEKFCYRLRRVWQYNPIGRARANVAHHYELSDALYDLFLDADRQYSCAYFTNANETLEAAQDNKKRHIAAKLLLNEPGLEVLDVGSGWGGLALYLARVAKAEVTGITLSAGQVKAANERAAAAGLGDRVRFFMRDYREEEGRYDRIVSVGMFEHVGVPHYPTFFGKIHELLKPGGVVLLHSIGRMEGPGVTNPWLRKYIFPGGYVPALSEVLAVIEKCGLWVTDIEILRLHYADTLREWHRRFQANRDKIKKLYDERFCRMWEFYLVGSEMGFRHGDQMVFQIQLAKSQDSVPLTRDYITDWKRVNADRVTEAA
ncbi:MAG: class I SAM-dependent methyltransferase [Acidobacteriota bacterium]